jgi:cadmium resistance protein CadD (predicted permease)
MALLTTALVLGLTVFVATNVDEVFVLLGFFADPKFCARQVIVGQYLGIGAIQHFIFAPSRSWSAK